MGPRSGRLIHQIILPIAVLVAVAMLVVVGFVWLSATNQDQIALRQSIDSVGDAIRRKTDQVGLVAKDYSWWTDSFRNLDQSFDPEWAHTNIGSYIYDLHGFELSFVIDRADRTIYGQIDGESTAAEAAALLSHGLERLIRQARAAPLEEPQPATGLLALGEQIVMVGVSAVTPEEGAEVVLPPGPRAVLVYVKKLDQAFLDTVAEPLPVTDLMLALPGAAAIAATLPLIAPDGARLGSLTWQPHQPGWEFLRSVFPSLAIAIAVIALFTVLVLRHARLAAATIEASEVRFRDVADASSDWIWETDPVSG